jgi:hypothetical protein
VYRDELGYYFDQAAQGWRHAKLGGDVEGHRPGRHL